MSNINPLEGEAFDGLVQAYTKRLVTYFHNKGFEPRNFYTAGEIATKIATRSSPAEEKQTMLEQAVRGGHLQTTEFPSEEDGGESEDRILGLDAVIFSFFNKFSQQETKRQLHLLFGIGFNEVSSYGFKPTGKRGGIPRYANIKPIYDKVVGEAEKAILDDNYDSNLFDAIQLNKKWYFVLDSAKDNYASEMGFPGEYEEQCADLVRTEARTVTDDNRCFFGYRSDNIEFQIVGNFIAAMRPSQANDYVVEDSVGSGPTTGFDPFVN